MTKEEAKTILQCRGNGYSEDEFNEALEIAYSALDSSLPSNLDDAAEDSWAVYEYRESPRGLYSTCYIDAFKAGAEWRAGQGVSMQGKVGIYGVDVENITKELREAGFKIGEEVTLQVRKK